MRPSIFDPGLSATSIAETSISEIDAGAGEVRVRGYPLGAIAEHATYAEAAWLVLDGRLPTAEERRSFSSELAGMRSLSPDQHQLVRTAAEESRPVMTVLRSALAMAEHPEQTEDTLLATRRVIASCPTIVAAYWRYRQGVPPVSPREELSHTSNFWYMLTGMEPDEPTRAGLETYLTTIVEHGINPSTFAARIVGSTGADPLSAATSAVGALAGPRHGGALSNVHSLLTSIGDDQPTAEEVTGLLADGGSLPGFGHSVYTGPDPRAAMLKAATVDLVTDRAEPSLLQSATDLAAVVTANTDGSQLHATVDFYGAVLLDALDIPPPLFPSIFAIGRVAGWMAHYLEQLESGTLLRPRSRYTGPEPRTWVTVEQRDSARARALDADELTEYAETLGLLAEPSRLELVLVLTDAGEPLSYATIRERSSITDKGRFNYHLRQLRGTLVESDHGTYTVTPVGTELVERLFEEDLVTSGRSNTPSDGEHTFPITDRQSSGTDGS